jgi:hypothetical protein
MRRASARPGFDQAAGDKELLPGRQQMVRMVTQEGRATRRHAVIAIGVAPLTRGRYNRGRRITMCSECRMNTRGG